MSKYIFNPYYTLKNDKKRVLLTNIQVQGNDFPDYAEESISSLIDPIFAVMFSHFNGKKEYDKVIDEIAELYATSYQEIDNFIKPFIENEKRIVVEYGNYFIEFPENIIIKMKSEFKPRTLSYKNFLIDEDVVLEKKRLFNGPSNITLLINTICLTDCIYCYVDRRKKMQTKISHDKIIEIIREAKNLGVIRFDIAGTEFFLYNRWYEVLEEFTNNDYYPYLTTKIPLKEDDILKLKKLGINKMQLSIDTVDIAQAKKVNRINDELYLVKMFNTLKMLNDNNIEVVINTVLTNINGDVDSIKNLLDKLNNYKIKKITLNPAERSDYWDSDDFDKNKLLESEINKIEDFIDTIRDRYKFNIHVAGATKKENIEGSFEFKKSNFDSRSLCTANITQFCILSDGQVTICEELYWNPKFIIGDINKQSILEIWNSDKALKLANLERDMFSDESVCKTCDEFDNCRFNPGVCWSNVAEAYGQENWDFPSPECPFAPKPIYSIHHD